MIEGVLVEINDREIPSFMVSVAICTDAGSGIVEKPVEACPIIDIDFNVFVTVEAQRPLLAPVERFVTGRALRFISGMWFGYWPGHNQRLDGLSRCQVDARIRDSHCKYRFPEPGTHFRVRLSPSVHVNREHMHQR